MKKRNIDWKNYIITVLFLSFLFLPNMVIPAINRFFEGKVGVNSAVHEAPELTFENIEEFPELFDKYYNNDLPFRDTAGELWARLNYFAFKDSTNAGVVLGMTKGDDSERWLFYDSKTDYSPIKDAQGLTDFSDGDMRKIVEKIGENKKELKKKGIKLYYFVAPSKESIYKEMMPESVDIFSETTRADKFYKYAEEVGVQNLVYPKKELLKTKELGQLYWKQDTHWNELGAGIAFRELLKKIWSDASYDFDYSFEKKQVDKDLSKMMNVIGYFEDDVVTIDHKSGSNDYEVTKKDGNTSDITVSVNRKAPIDKTVMVVGDSYRNATKPFFMRMFKKCILLHRNDYKKAMLEEYGVDVVVLEFVERYLPMVGKYSL